MPATMLGRLDADSAGLDRMVRKHLPLVHFVARKLHDRVDGAVELDDLVSAGSVGLVEAVRSFDAERGLAFSTFAAPRIRGAMLDDLRRNDLLSRSARRKQRELNEVRHRLETRLQRPVTQVEMANQLDVPLETFCQWQSDAAGCTVPLEAVNSSPTERKFDSEVALESTIDQELNQREEMELLKAEIEALPERDRLVLTLSYFQGLKLSQIAQVLGITESRVSQIRTRAISVLRERLAHLQAA